MMVSDDENDEEEDIHSLDYDSSYYRLGNEGGYSQEDESWPDSLEVSECFYQAVNQLDLWIYYMPCTLGDPCNTRCMDEIDAYMKVMREDIVLTLTDVSAVLSEDSAILSEDSIICYNEIRNGQKILLGSQTVWKGLQSMIEVIRHTVTMLSFLKENLFSQTEETKYNKSLQILMGTETR
jgi:hypothetical protein